MGGASIWHWVVVGVVVMLLFGRGKISEMMGDVAKGIKAFKKGMSEDEAAAAANVQGTPVVTTTTASDPLRTLDHRNVEPAASSSTLADRKVG